MIWECPRPRPSSKLKFLGYASFTVPKSGMRPSSRLGLKPHPTYGRWSTCTIPPAIKEDAPSSSEARDAPEEVEAVGFGAILAITSLDEPAKESKPSGAAGASKG